MKSGGRGGGVTDSTGMVWNVVDERKRDIQREGRGKSKHFDTFLSRIYSRLDE